MNDKTQQAESSKLLLKRERKLKKKLQLDLIETKLSLEQEQEARRKVQHELNETKFNLNAFIDEQDRTNRLKINDITKQLETKTGFVETLQHSLQHEMDERRSSDLKLSQTNKKLQLFR